MILWTKEWSGADDGTIVSGIDLQNIQQDLANITFVDHSWITYEDDIITYEGDVVYVS